MASRKLSVIWSPEANADVIEIWNYLSEAAGPRTANSVLLKIKDSVHPLQFHPYIGRTRENIRAGRWLQVSM